MNENIKLAVKEIQKRNEMKKSHKIMNHIFKAKNKLAVKLGDLGVAIKDWKLVAINYSFKGKKISNERINANILKFKFSICEYMRTFLDLKS